MSSLASRLRGLPDADEAARAAVHQRAASVLRPPGALAAFDEVAVWLAGWQRTDRPAVERPGIVMCVAEHGVAARGVSAYPSAVTGHMLEALRQGAATASVMARLLGAEVRVVDVGVGRPTGDLTVEPALSPQRFDEAVDGGVAAVASLAEERGVDLLVLGEVGIGNTTAAAAVAHALFGGTAADWVGRGTGVDDEGLVRKQAAVAAGGARIAGTADPLEVLREVGGAELVAMAGACVEARRRSIPVLLDGYVVTAAVAPLALAAPGALDHCLAGHQSGEPGHARLLEQLGLQPLLRLDLRLGEGSGALAALPLVRLAAACVTDVATFEEWGLA